MGDPPPPPAGLRTRDVVYAPVHCPAAGSVLGMRAEVWVRVPGVDVGAGGAAPTYVPAYLPTQREERQEQVRASTHSSTHTTRITPRPASYRVHTPPSPPTLLPPLFPTTQLATHPYLCMRRSTRSPQANSSSGSGSSGGTPARYVAALKWEEAALEALAVAGLLDAGVVGTKREWLRSWAWRYPGVSGW
ncbi:hypothetical protein B0H16DRAFT_1720820 [Mycena metata]|uniref:Uncharacterized protein n=1 Tax=Mycena metata TaxID=1033252 RepID=A0AAD7NEJ5_9AGAR|nr:hypothetical protein B0H16DRAFT_1720820 [Mycena metata]